MSLVNLHVEFLRDEPMRCCAVRCGAARRIDELITWVTSLVIVSTVTYLHYALRLVQNTYPPHLAHVADQSQFPAPNGDDDNDDDAGGISK